MYIANNLENKLKNPMNYLYTLDGRVIEVYLNESNIDDTSKGKVFKFTDITYRIESEEFKRKSEKDKIKLQEEIKYNELRVQLFSNVSHELKTPLNIILGIIQLINATNINEYKIERTDKFNNYISMMKKNCYRLLRILNNLIDTARYDAGFINMNLEYYNIINIVEDISLSIVPFAEEKGINIVFDTEIEESIILCDPDKIERIILNILSNAIKFTPNNGKIFINIYQGNKDIDIVIEDTGIGIPEEKIVTILERFGQVSSDLSKKSEGNGIGLYLVKTLIEAHGGQLSLESNVGKGTKFKINLPTNISVDNNIDKLCNTYENDGLVERLNVELSDIYDAM